MEENRLEKRAGILNGYGVTSVGLANLSGCYADSPDSQVDNVLVDSIFLPLANLYHRGNTILTDCVYTCKFNDFLYTAFKNGNECYCGRGIKPSVQQVAKFDLPAFCATPCAGYEGAICGGPNAVLAYFWTDRAPATTTTTQISPSSADPPATNSLESASTNTDVVPPNVSNSPTSTILNTGSEPSSKDPNVLLENISQTIVSKSSMTNPIDSNSLKSLVSEANSASLSAGQSSDRSISSKMDSTTGKHLPDSSFNSVDYSYMSFSTANNGSVIQVPVVPSEKSTSNSKVLAGALSGTIGFILIVALVFCLIRRKKMRAEKKSKAESWFSPPIRPSDSIGISPFSPTTAALLNYPRSVGSTVDEITPYDGPRFTALSDPKVPNSFTGYQSFPISPTRNLYDEVNPLIVSQNLSPLPHYPAPVSSNNVYQKAEVTDRIQSYIDKLSINNIDKLSMNKHESYFSDRYLQDSERASTFYEHSSDHLTSRGTIVNDHIDDTTDSNSVPTDMMDRTPYPMSPTITNAKIANPVEDLFR